MSVLMLNGSPHAQGCTFTALSECARGLEDGGLKSEIAWVGKDTYQPCIACGGCRESGYCAFGKDDGVNDLIDRMIAAEGVIIGSPVFYAGVNGALKCLLDRMFFASGSRYALKPAACVVSARRAGTTSTLEQLQKFPIIAQMPLVSSFYWPMVHGNNPDEVRQDVEGMQIMYQLGANMAWLIRSIAAGVEAKVPRATVADRTATNFIH